MQERLRLVLDASLNGIWDWNLLTNEVYFSPRWKEMIGYEDEELENRLETWKDHIHPDDVEKTLSDVEISQTGKMKYFKSVFRFKHKNGQWLWIKASGTTLFNEAGEAIRMIGSPLP